MSIYADQFDVLVTTTLDKVRPILRDQISNENALTAYLNMKSRVTIDGGTVIRRPLLVAFNDTVSSYSGYDLIDTTPQEGLGWAEFTWRQHAGSVTISGEEVKKNSGAAQLINLLQAKVDQLKLSIADDMNAMLWASSAGNSGKDFDSVPLIVKSATAVGGIDPSTYTWWKSPVAASTVDLSDFEGIKTLNNLFNTVRLNRSKVDVEFTTQAVFEAYEALAVPNVRFQNLKAADLGFETIAHKTAELIMDLDCPSAALYMLNSDRLEFVQHADSWVSPTDFVRPANQDAKVALVLSMGNLITDSRRSHAYATGIVTA
jgi:hypothetical protein